MITKKKRFYVHWFQCIHSVLIFQTKYIKEFIGYCFIYFIFLKGVWYLSSKTADVDYFMKIKCMQLCRPRTSELKWKHVFNHSDLFCKWSCKKTIYRHFVIFNLHLNPSVFWFQASAYDMFLWNEIDLFSLICEKLVLLSPENFVSVWFSGELSQRNYMKNAYTSASRCN